MPQPQKVYLDDNGEPITSASGTVYLDDHGEPLNTLGLTGPPQSKEKAPWNAKDSHNASEVLKQFLGLGGALVGSTLGPAGTIAGNSIGRTIGHIPEALSSRSTGQPNDSSFAGDAALGAMEGGAAEFAPAALGLSAKWGGKGLRLVGDAASAMTGGSKLGAPIRGILAHGLGLGYAGDAAAMAVPPVMSATGRGLERAGEAVGTKTLSQRTGPAMDALMGRDAELAASAAERRATLNKSMGIRQGQEVPYRAGSGTSDGFSVQPERPSEFRAGNDWPINEPVFGDARPALADMEKWDALIAQDFKGDPTRIAEWLPRSQRTRNLVDMQPSRRSSQAMDALKRR